MNDMQEFVQELRSFVYKGQKLLNKMEQGGMMGQRNNGGYNGGGYNQRNFPGNGSFFMGGDWDDNFNQRNNGGYDPRYM